MTGKTGPPEQQTGGEWKDRATGETDRRGVERGATGATDRGEWKEEPRAQQTGGEWKDRATGATDRRGVERGATGATDR